MKSSRSRALRQLLWSLHPHTVLKRVRRTAGSLAVRHRIPFLTDIFSSGESSDPNKPASPATGPSLPLVLGTGFGVGAALGLTLALSQHWFAPRRPPAVVQSPALIPSSLTTLPNGRPRLSPLPAAQQVWNCEVVVIGGSLGGVAAASEAMQSGAQTCLIELTPWLGGQVSSQGVSAIDESRQALQEEAFSEGWNAFKRLILEQKVVLPEAAGFSPGRRAKDVNNCWVGRLCIPPEAGARASQEMLQASSKYSPNSRWGTQIAFKGAEFDNTGKLVTAVYAVQRVPRRPDYLPQGRFSDEIKSWYAWASDNEFEKVPIKLQAPPGKRLLVIDASDTGELVGWADIPHRLGADAQSITGETHAPPQDNPDCTQAFTYPFTLGVYNDGGRSRAFLSQVKSLYPAREHIRQYSMHGFPMFVGLRNFFTYRRIASKIIGGDRFRAVPSPGDITMVNWNTGNDWTWMNPPLILRDDQLDTTGQRQNWMGGLSSVALRHGEDHALLFARWLLENQAQPSFPLTYLFGADTPMGTQSGLSMVPYIREGRRILGRKAYGQRHFMLRANDIVRGTRDGRNFEATSVAMTHYAIDIHGCRYRNGEPSGEASSAPTPEDKVRPSQIPLEALIPEGVENVLIGGKSLAVTHIVNAMTRVHHNEWNIGEAAGAIAGWLTTQAPPDLLPAEIVPKGWMPQLRHYKTQQGLQHQW